MARGRYSVPRIRHRAGGASWAELGIISPRTKIFAESIFAGEMSASRISGGTILSGDILIGSPIRLRISANNKSIRVYDNVGSLRIELGSLL